MRALKHSYMQITMLEIDDDFFLSEKMMSIWTISHFFEKFYKKEIPLCYRGIHTICDEALSL
mgnify:FL=1